MNSSGGESSSSTNPAGMAFLQTLAARESLADSLHQHRQFLIDGDKRRQSNRTALRHLSRLPSTSSSGRQHWYNLSGLFIRLPTSSCENLLNADQELMEEEMGKVREEMKVLGRDLLERGEERGKVEAMMRLSAAR